MKREKQMKSSSLFRHVDACLAFCEKHSASDPVIGIPMPLSGESLDRLLAREGVAGVVVWPTEELRARRQHPRVGFFVPEAYTWDLPDTAAHCVTYFGPRHQLSFRMVRRAYNQGFHWVVYGTFGCWRKEHVLVFMLRRCVEKCFWTAGLMLLRLKNALRRRWKRLARLANPFFWIMDSFLGATKRTVFQLKEQVEKRIGEHRIRHFFSQYGKGVVPDYEPVLGRVLLVNSALAWGGAERQVVNTLHGLADHGVTDIALLCENLHLSDDHRFFMEQLGNIRLDHLDAYVCIEDLELSDEETERIVHAVSLLPEEIRGDVVRYLVDFVRRRPSVVHIWQDITNIKAGIAAVLAGVPRIVLAGRNVSPRHFAYYKSYMRPIYRGLVKCPQVGLINNSRAGAEDYADWLRISPSDIRVIHNGMHRNFICRAGRGEVARYRRKLGIPDAAPVVGAIFRFYEEKDPLLWIRAAGMVARKRKDVWFLLVGTGPMREDIQREANHLGFGDRLIMPGTEKKAALPLSVMDVFLLTSRHEGTPNVLIEAQWLGLPVVSTRAGGSADTFVHGRTGWLVDRRVPDLLAEKVVQILADEKWRKEAAKFAPCFVQQEFALERMIQETLDCYGLPCRGRGTMRGMSMDIYEARIQV